MFALEDRDLSLPHTHTHTSLFTAVSCVCGVAPRAKVLGGVKKLSSLSAAPDVRLQKFKTAHSVFCLRSNDSERQRWEGGLLSLRRVSRPQIPPSLPPSSSVVNRTFQIPLIIFILSTCSACKSTLIGLLLLYTSRLN